MIRSNGLFKFVQVGIGLIGLGYYLISKFKSNQIKIETNWRLNQRITRNPNRNEHHPIIDSHQTFECDPYSEPGSLYSSSNLHQSRYIIYNDHLQSTLSNHQINQSDWMVPSYSHQLHQNRFDQVGWLKNKSILLIGDSIDRNLVIHFARRALKGTKGYHQFWKASDQINVPVTKLESHQIGISYLPELNFTVYNWFLMGCMVQEEVPFFHPREDLPQDYQSKLNRFYLPLISKKVLPLPDLVIFNSGFWDLDYLARSRAVQYPLPISTISKTWENEPKDTENDLGDGNPLSLNELSVHRSRFKSFINSLKSSLDELQKDLNHSKSILYMYRSMQLGNATDRNAFSPTRVKQIDSSNLALVKEMKIKVLDWGKMTVGLDRQLTDPPIHYGIGSAQYIFGDMMLFYLKQHVLGDVDEWIGCKWIKERRDRIRLGLD